MKVKVFPFSTYNGLMEHNNILPLKGCESLYSNNLQTALIKTFNIDDNKSSIPYYFEVNGVYLYPKCVYDNPLIDQIMEGFTIFVSNDIYDQYFGSCNSSYEQFFNLNTIYNVPNIDMIRLKRIDGYFPQNNSIDDLLTDFFESSLIINLHQEFTLEFDCNDLPFENFIKFKIDEIIYKDEIKKNINDRLDELNYTITFNKNINELNDFVGIEKCENKVFNFAWNFCAKTKQMLDDDKKKQNLVGVLKNNEVKIDFIVSEPVKPQIIETKTEIIKPQIIETKVEQVVDTNIEININSVKILSKEELRAKRLQAFNNYANK